MEQWIDAGDRVLPPFSDSGGALSGSNTSSASTFDSGCSLGVGISFQEPPFEAPAWIPPRMSIALALLCSLALWAAIWEVALFVAATVRRQIF